MKKMGRLERLASALAESHVEYQTTASDPRGSSTAPSSLGRGPFARTGVSVERVESAAMAASLRLFMYLLTGGGGKSYGDFLFFVCGGYFSSSFSSVSGSLFPVLDVSRMWNWWPMVVGWVRVWNWRMSLKFSGVRFSSSVRSQFLAWVVR